MKEHLTTKGGVCMNSIQELDEDIPKKFQIGDIVVLNKDFCKRYLDPQERWFERRKRGKIIGYSKKTIDVVCVQWFQGNPPLKNREYLHHDFLIPKRYAKIRE